MQIGLVCVEEEESDGASPTLHIELMDLNCHVYGWSCWVKFIYLNRNNLINLMFYDVQVPHWP